MCVFAFNQQACDNRLEKLLWMSNLLSERRPVVQSNVVSQAPKESRGEGSRWPWLLISAVLSGNHLLLCRENHTTHSFKCAVIEPKEAGGGGVADLDVVLGRGGDRHRVEVLRGVVDDGDAGGRVERSVGLLHVDRLLGLDGDRLVRLRVRLRLRVRVRVEG